MQTKHLCVLIHIWTRGEVDALLNRFKPSSKIFLLTVLRRCFFCGSFMLFLSCLLCFHVRLLLMSCDHLGKGRPLGSYLWCLMVTLSLSHWYPWSGVVLDCIYSWSLSSFLLILLIKEILKTGKHHTGKFHDNGIAYKSRTKKARTDWFWWLGMNQDAHWIQKKTVLVFQKSLNLNVYLLSSMIDNFFGVIIHADISNCDKLKVKFRMPQFCMTAFYYYKLCLVLLKHNKMAI